MIDNRKFYASGRTSEDQARPAPSLGTLGVMALVPFLVLFLVVAGSLWWWYGWRIEPENGKIVMLIKKTGKNLPVDQIIAPSLEYKGVQLEVLPEGRFFYNPYVWDWKVMNALP